MICKFNVISTDLIYNIILSQFLTYQNIFKCKYFNIYRKKRYYSYHLINLVFNQMYEL